MKTYNKLVRDKTIKQLKELGFDGFKGKQLEGEQYKIELYSLFLDEYKSTLDMKKNKKVQLHYAEMLEIVRTLMITEGMDVRKIGADENKTLTWYKNSGPKGTNLTSARIDLLEKYDELLCMKTEAVKDQLIDIFGSFRTLVEAHNIPIQQIEEFRKALYAKSGGYSKGIYLESVSKINTSTYTY